MKRILWFRRDLRIDDNPLLSFESEVLPIFIFDTNILDSLSPNDRRLTFIFNALQRLKQSLRDIGLDLAVFYGKPVDVFSWLIQYSPFGEVCASGDYDHYARTRDRDISHLLPFNYVHDTYIFKPDEILKSDGSPYLVFTPYYKKVKEHFNNTHMTYFHPAKQHPILFDYGSIHHIDASMHKSLPFLLQSIGFEPQMLNDNQKRLPEEKLSHFETKLSGYSKMRDYPSLDATSELSTDLRFGTISIRSVLRWLFGNNFSEADTEPFFRQLVFREFYAMLLFHFPDLEWKNFRYPFTGIENLEYFNAFCSGRTGVPIIDAAIHQLLQSGEMHNRTRMICASFFTKNLLLPWQWGERFFAEHLMDYDASSNILSWQWSSGTGVDPQPYFRIFNPYTQTDKFDKDGVYIKQYLPILSHLPSKILANEEQLQKLNIEGYPHPLVEHHSSSKEALSYFKSCL